MVQLPILLANINSNSICAQKKYQLAGNENGEPIEPGRV